MFLTSAYYSKHFSFALYISTASLCFTPVWSLAFCFNVPLPIHTTS